jgi:hypothetical protein
MTRGHTQTSLKQQGERTKQRRKKRVAVKHARTIEMMRKKKPSGPPAKGKKKRTGAGVTLERNMHRDKEPVNNVSESEDEEFDVEQWKCVEHRSVNGKPSFRVNCGKRKGGGRKHMWGS